MFPKKLVLVPGKTPPDASGSRPDSQIRKVVGRRSPPFRSTRPQGEMRQPTGGLGRDLLVGRWAEVLRRGSSRNRPLRHVFLSAMSGASRCGFAVATDSAKSYRHNITNHAARSLSTAVLGPTDPGGTGRPGSADLVKRKAFRPALLLTAIRCYPFRQEASLLSEAFRRGGCCVHQLAPVTASSPDFPLQRRGRSLSRRSAIYSSGTFTYRHHDSRRARLRQDQTAPARKILVHNNSDSTQCAHRYSPVLSTCLTRAAHNILILLIAACVFRSGTVTTI